MSELHIDFESFSRVELSDKGLDNYASDPSTDIHCMAYAFDDEPVQIITPYTRNIVANAVIEAHVKYGGIVIAHNAAFELAIWNKVCVPKYGWPELKIEQMRCTMAMSYAMALPGSLENASAALGVAQAKDTAGARVMMQLAKPKANGNFYTIEEAPEKFERLYAYCKQDVEVERALAKRLMPLSDSEQALWVLDQKINQRGVPIDLPSIEQAIKLVSAEKERLDAEMLKVTGGVVGKCTEVQLLVKWIRSQGVALEGLAKADVINALSPRADSLPREVRRALELRQEAAKSSTAKLIAMRDRASADGRVRGTLQYHGASTGRWAGRGIQVQNFPRPRPATKPNHIDDIFSHLGDRDYIDMNYGPVLDALADSLRGMITARKGHDLVAMDFSAIEARVLAWLAGEEKVLDIFRTHGKIYEHAAAGIYNKTIEGVNKDERQIGKVAVLALGYGGGVGAFQSMARNYGVKVEDAKAEDIKKAWRDSHKKIVSYWYDVEAAAINAVELGVVCKAGAAGRQVAFKKSGSFLWCQLPNKRVLCYPYPVVKQTETPWGEMKSALNFMSVNGVTRKWEETKTYGGSLVENLTQAVARDLLAEAITRLEANRYPVVFHAHDEAVIELPDSEGSIEEIESIMNVVPAWATGLPLSSEGWRAKRYRK